MTEPAYVRIAGRYAHDIRSGELHAGTQLRSYAELAERHDVSQSVIRKAVDLLINQGLVRSAARRGIFVADRPDLRRLSPERQLEDPRTSFANESSGAVKVETDTETIPATDEIAAALGISAATRVKHVVTRAKEDGRPISISDSYQPVDANDVSAAVLLEETLADRLPTPSHAEWLRTPPGDLIKAVQQRFLASAGQVLMVSNISYQRDRYDSFVFRMSLPPSDAPG